MVYILSILYSVFLGTIARNLVIVQPSQVGNTFNVSVISLIKKDNISRVLPLTFLFLIDWCVFLLIFQFPQTSQGGTTLAIEDIFLILCFLCSMVSLAHAVFLSFDTNDKNKCCLYAGWYYVLSTFGEVVWFSFLLYPLFKSGTFISPLIPMALIIYLAVKFLFAALSFTTANAQVQYKPALIFIISCLLKPASVLIYNLF